MKRINATALRTPPFAAPATALPTPISRKENTMKTRLSSFIRRCAVQVLALVALAASSAFAQSTPGQIGDALSFDGVDDWVEIPTSDHSIYALYPPWGGGAGSSDELTIEAWFRVDELVPGKTHNVFSMGRQDIDLRIMVEEDGQLQAGVLGRDMQRRVKVYIPMETPSRSVVEGQWHHVAFVVQMKHLYANIEPSTYTTLYFDGSEVDDQRYAAHQLDWTWMTQMAIGKELKGGYYFGGRSMTCVSGAFGGAPMRLPTTCTVL